jgi:hypothetical protein
MSRDYINLEARLDDLHGIDKSGANIMKYRAFITLAGKVWRLPQTTCPNYCAYERDALRIYFAPNIKEPIRDGDLNFLVASMPVQELEPLTLKACQWLEKKILAARDMEPLPTYVHEELAGPIGVERVGNVYEAFLELWGSELLVGTRSSDFAAAQLHDLAAQACWNIPAPARFGGATGRKQGFELNNSTPTRDGVAPAISSLNFVPTDADLRDVAAFKQRLLDINGGRELPYWDQWMEKPDVCKAKLAAPRRNDVKIHDRAVVRHVAACVAKARAL